MELTQACYRRCLDSICDLGHPGPQASEHLINCSRGARIHERGPMTVERDECGMAKAKRQIRREAKELYEGGINLSKSVDSYTSF
jgi:hypothetical protein